ncbi:MAG: AAA family ATPase [Planctomycetota bacterium]
MTTRHNAQLHRLDAPRPSRMTCDAAVALGFTFEDVPSVTPPTLDPAIDADAITLITGPSGSGKSCMLRSAIEAFEARDVRVVTPTGSRLRNLPALDLLRMPPPDGMRALAEVGLAEFAVFARRPGELSDGQLERLRLALALAAIDRAPRSTPCVLVVDEFGARVDPVAAKALAHTLGRAVRGRRGVRPLGALLVRHTPDLAPDLRADRVIRIALDQRVCEIDADSLAEHRALTERLAIGLADTSTYRALARYHYRPSPPAGAVRCRAAHDEATGELAGVLITAMPSLNSSWRRHAWGDRYATGDKRADAKRINAEIRRIARVVIDPRYRGLGLAARLVRAELADPLTPRTEAMAAMGTTCPFFERAGMTPYHTPAPAHHARLLDALAYLGIEPWRLADPAGVWTRATINTSIRRFFEDELARWTRAPTTPKHLRRTDDPREALRCACRSIATAPIGYAHDARRAGPIDP